MKRNNGFCRFAALLLIAAMLLCIPVPALAEEENTVIYINTADDFLDFAQGCTLDTWSRGKTFVLSADISLSGASFQQVPTFGGSFDGGMHTISDFVLTDSLSPAGLFGVIQQDAEVKNLNVSGTVAPTGTAKAVGGIAGENNGSISGCRFTGSVSGAESTGGIVGVNGLTGVVQSCQTGGGVFGQTATGGIVGTNLGLISSCRNECYVNIKSVDPSIDLGSLNLDLTQDLTALTRLGTINVATDTGGIAGYSSGTVSSCSSGGVIGYQHSGYNVGGIVGRSSGYVSNCSSSAEVFGRKDIGGIVGQMEPYIAADLSEDILSALRSELSGMSGLVDQMISDAGDTVTTVTSRLNKVSDYIDAASQAAENLRPTISMNGSASGSGQSSAGVSGSFDPSQIDISGDGISHGTTDITAGIAEGINAVRDSVTSADISAGLTEATAELTGGGDTSGRLDTSAQITADLSLSQLCSAINGITSQLRLLGSEVSGASSSLVSDLQAVRTKSEGITGLFFDAANLTGNQSITDRFSDTSEADIDSVTSGKVYSCTNKGRVYGDLNVGGIAGSMASEYALDPEEDVSLGSSSLLRQKYEIKAIIQSCVSTGDIVSKKDCVGAICGRMNIGLILTCEGCGSASSESGDYVGGIAGLAGSTIRNSGAKCTLSGRRYVGGIVGCGTSDGLSGAGSIVSQCRSLVNITACQQYCGAISGFGDGTYLENLYVSDTLAGINGLSFAGQAEPCGYEELYGAEEMPSAFKSFTVSFVADGVTILSRSLEYGDSFAASDFPDIPPKEGCYAHWDTEELKNIRFDTVVTAVYASYVTALTSGELRSNDRPVFFAEGFFDDESTLTASPASKTPEELEEFSGDIFKALSAFLKSGALSDMTITRDIAEQWHIEIPDDGRTTHTIRYLPLDGSSSGLNIYVKPDGGSWEKADCGAVGSYITFNIPTCSADIAVLSTAQVWWIWLIAALAAAIIISLLIRLCIRLFGRRRKKADKAQKNAVDGKNGESRDADGVQSETDAQLSPEDAAADEEKPGGASRKKLPAGESAQSAQKKAKSRKKKKAVWLTVAACLVIGCAAGAAIYFNSGLRSGTEIFALLENINQKPELDFSLDVSAKIGSESVETDLAGYRTTVLGHKLLCVEQYAVPLYYSDGAVLLENGKVYHVSDLSLDYSHMLDIIISVAKHTSISSEKKNGITTYTINASGENAQELLTALLPGYASAFFSVDAANIYLDVTGAKLTDIRFEGSGAINDGKDSPFSLRGQLEINEPASPEREIPQAVTEAVTGGALTGGSDITGDMFRIVFAWAELNARDPLSAKVTLSANCGPLLLDDTLEYYRTSRDGHVISCARRNGESLYFTDSAVYTGSKIAAGASDSSATSFKRLIDIAYQLCLNGDLESTSTGDEYTYTLSLSDSQLKSVAAGIAPETANMDISFLSGSLSIKIKDRTITELRFDCSGTTKIVIADVAVSMSGKFDFSNPGGSINIAIPAEAVMALTTD